MHANRYSAERTSSLRPTRMIAVLAVSFALFGAACGSGDAADTDTGATTTSASDTSADASTTSELSDSDGETEDTASARAATGVSNDCSDGQRGDGSYIVTNIPANDADGGLVLRTAAGPDRERVDVLPADAGVFVDGSYGCAVVGASVWWEIGLGEGFTAWANSAFLGRYQGPGDRQAVGTTAAMCSAYGIVSDSQETDLNATAAMIALDAELGGHPVGVSAAIAALVNGGFSADDYDTIRNYVGPICDSGGGAAGGGVDYDEETLATTAQDCLLGVAEACDAVQGLTMSPIGALARAFVEAVMDDDQATIAQLADQDVIDSMWVVTEPAAAGFGIESIQVDSDTAFSFTPFPTAGTSCEVTGGFISSCTYAP